MTRYVLTIPGKPFAKQRPRFSRRSGRAYTPSETVSFERQVGMIAALQIREPIVGPVSVDVLAIFEPPKSWSKKRRAEALESSPPAHIQKPDADNLGKAILDGLNRIAFADDAQVYRQVCEKRWGLVPQTTVIIQGGP